MKRRSPKSYAQALFLVLQEAKTSDHQTVIRNFFEVLRKQRSLRLMPRILTEIQKLEDTKAGITRVGVQSAVEINEKTIAQQLQKALGPVAIDLSEDPALVGGLKLRIGDTMIDGSVATQLRHLHTHLTSA